MTDQKIIKSTLQLLDILLNLVNHHKVTHQLPMQIIKIW